MVIAKKSVRISRQLTQKRIPRECQLPGDSLCLLTLALTIKPLANVKASYTCYDSQKEIGENFQDAHLLSVARLEKGSVGILAYMVEFEKPPMAAFLIVSYLSEPAVSASDVPI